MFAALCCTLLLAACGGNGDDSHRPVASSATAGTLLPTIWTSDGRILNSCSFSPACSGNPYAPFTVVPSAATTVLPDDGALLRGFVRLQVRGIEMGNVELLPASGYTPRLGVFTLSRDRTTAWLDLDTTMLPNGPIAVRVSAFNVAAGQPNAIELTAMPPRIWNIANTILPPPGFGAELAAAPADGAAVTGFVHLEIHGAGIANAELLPAQGYAPRYGQFNVSADKTMAWLDLDSRSLPDGLRDVRISAFNVTEGQPNASELVAMLPRRWNFANGATSAFTSTITSAPLHGETVRGTVVLEVRGSGMKNVELLPAGGYAPILGRFTATPDGAFAFLEFDTKALPNGPVDVRVSAFNAPPGQPGAQEIVAMPSRQWIVAN